MIQKAYTTSLILVVCRFDVSCYRLEEVALFAITLLLEGFPIQIRSKVMIRRAGRNIYMSWKCNMVQYLP